MLAIMSLMLGAVVMAIPSAPAPITQQAKRLTAQINHAAQNGVLSNEVIALAVSRDGYAIVTLNEEAVADTPITPWAEFVRVDLTRDGQALDLPETPSEGGAVPLFFFEPTGGATVFSLTLRGESKGEGERFVIHSRGDGRVTLAILS